MECDICGKIIGDKELMVKVDKVFIWSGDFDSETENWYHKSCYDKSVTPPVSPPKEQTVTTTWADSNGGHGECTMPYKPPEGIHIYKAVPLKDTPKEQLLIQEVLVNAMNTIGEVSDRIKRLPLIYQQPPAPEAPIDTPKAQEESESYECLNCGEHRHLEGMYGIDGQITHFLCTDCKKQNIQATLVNSETPIERIEELDLYFCTRADLNKKLNEIVRAVNQLREELDSKVAKTESASKPFDWISKNNEEVVERANKMSSKKNWRLK